MAKASTADMTSPPELSLAEAERCVGALYGAILTVKREQAQLGAVQQQQEAVEQEIATRQAMLPQLDAEIVAKREQLADLGRQIERARMDLTEEQQRVTAVRAIWNGALQQHLAEALVP